MLVAKTVSEIRSQLKNCSNVIFVPTMGALHEGHISLIKKATEISSNVVVSIFVNKAQFNDLKDYEKYPKQIDSDLEMLAKSGASHVFIPDDAEIFNQDFGFKITPTKLVDCLCGKSRNGHFEGVALIVSKLFNIIKPQVAIFGQKDFQQVAIIRKMVADLNFDIEVIAQPTMREISGLAMSSRNQRLSVAALEKASEIFKALNEVRDLVTKTPAKTAQIIAKKSEELLEKGFEKIDYFEIRDEKNLQLIECFQAEMPSRLFIATFLEGVRLIDNLKL